MTLFTRADLIEALRELIAELQTEGETVGLRLVGGAALALRYFDRPSTQNLDALHVRPGTDETVALGRLDSRDRGNGVIYVVSSKVAIRLAGVSQPRALRVGR